MAITAIIQCHTDQYLISQKPGDSHLTNSDNFANILSDAGSEYWQPSCCCSSVPVSSHFLQQQQPKSSSYMSAAGIIQSIINQTVVRKSHQISAGRVFIKKLCVRTTVRSAQNYETVLSFFHYYFLIPDEALLEACKIQNWRFNYEHYSTFVFF